MQAWTMDGRLAVVTGGSRGIGAAIVGELLALGARVMAEVLAYLRGSLAAEALPDVRKRIIRGLLHRFNMKLGREGPSPCDS
jgi:NAD(P)-dependent dehydrogenase (short-subunit alcohol dehydrogenase family)